MKVFGVPGGLRSPGLLFVLTRVIFPGILVLAALTPLPLFRMFVVEAVRSRGIVFLRPLRPDFRFSLSYTHSVNKSEITDRFGLTRDGAIVLRGSRFLSFGAGVATEDAGQFSGEGAFLEYHGINRELPEFRVFAGTEADHRFLWDGGSFHFLERVAPQTGLLFRVRRVSPAEIILYRVRKGVLHEKRS